MNLPECPLCALIPGICNLDLVHGEGEFPEACRQLKGFPDSLGVPLRRRLACPLCDQAYSLEIETGCMEWDLRLVRERLGD